MSHLIGLLGDIDIVKRLDNPGELPDRVETLGLVVGDVAPAAEATVQ